MKDLTGKRFERLVVISKAYKKNRTWYWNCKCDCGNETIACGSKLTIKLKKSCGCFKAENIKPKYGSDHKQWKGVGKLSGSVWNRIIQTAKKRKIDVKLTIKDAWKLFEQQSGKCKLTGNPISFAASSKELKEGKNTASLDRIDSNKSYELGNVQWVHVDVNYMKQWFEQKKFLDWCKKIVDYNHI